GAPGTNPPGAQMASVGPAATAPAPAPGGGVEVGRTDLLGGWTISSSGSSCQLFMSLTTWTGGYRATTRGCSAPGLQGVSAWNLEGNQVRLVDGSGATVARLYPSSKTQFNGQTEAGAAVSFNR
ncbi:AprI/Inh family metalloprotease inhibitor, partial [Propylenella binzhouense]